VEDLDIAPMLDASDLSPPGSVPTSLLSGAATEAAGAAILGRSGGGLRPRRRAWLADPFRVVLALTNLRGVPYRVAFGPDGGGGGRDRSSRRLEHADHAPFAFSAGGSDVACLGLRGDERLVRGAAEWERFAEFAKASAASPGGFPARRLSRPAADYDWRASRCPASRGGRRAWHPAARPGKRSTRRCGATSRIVSTAWTAARWATGRRSWRAGRSTRGAWPGR
jgi:hypothetical protein